MSICESEIAMYDNDESDCAMSPPVLRLSKMFENCMSPECGCGTGNSGARNRGNRKNAVMDSNSCSSSPEQMDNSHTPPSVFRATPSLPLGTPFAASFWDSGLGFPMTPVASSTLAPCAPRRPAFRGSGLMPIPFAYDEREEAQSDEGTTNDSGCTAAVPTTPPTDPPLNCGNSQLDDSEKLLAPLATPLGRSLNSLIISATPRSLIQRRAAQKSLEKVHRLKALSTRDRRSVSGRRRAGLGRPSADPEGPQVNMNPFIATVGLDVSTVKKNETLPLSLATSCTSDRINPYVSNVIH